MASAVGATPASAQRIGHQRTSGYVDRRSAARGNGYLERRSRIDRCIAGNPRRGDENQRNHCAAFLSFHAARSNQHTRIDRCDAHAYCLLPALFLR
jgi:hypothetical protein